AHVYQTGVLACPGADVDVVAVVHHFLLAAEDGAPAGGR
ncbi:MAG: hypothetical protein RLZZ526_643, partial [Actinomycetota bacterium]